MVAKQAAKRAPSRAQSVLEEMCERYWNAFRAGYCRAGGRPEDYPTWAESTDPVKVETRRCMRHAVEALRDEVIVDGAVDDWFPEPVESRSMDRIRNDDDFVKSAAIARIGG